MITGNELMQPIVKPGFVYTDGSYEETTVKGGLTIRQHFAAMAMQAILSRENSGYYNPSDREVSELSVQHADALIAELNKQPV